MTLPGWFCLAIIVATVIALAMSLAAPEVIVMSSVTVLLVVGILTPESLSQSLGSPAVLSVGALLVLARGVRQTGMLAIVVDYLLGRRPSRDPLLRLGVPTAAVSAFLNNTPIVAIFAPAVIDWCKRTGVTPSRMLIPLSYATILGGMTTLIGTSTTLVVDGLMRQHGLAGLSMFEISPVGVPAAVGGVLLVALLAPRLLPDRRDPVATINRDRREYLVEVLVDHQSPLVGQRIADAGLRHLPGLFLMNIERGGRFVGPVGPDEQLAAGDRLVFTGVASTVADLRRFPGLVPASESHYDPTTSERRDRLYEVVVSSASPLVGRSIKEAGFRRRYDAAVLAVHRASRRLPQKLGQVVLRAGDTLMLEAGVRFGERYVDHVDFALVSRLRTDVPPRPKKVGTALLILIVMVLLVATRTVPLVGGALAAVGAMLLLRVLDGTEARRALDVPMLLVIGGALALGRALEDTGVALALSRFVLDHLGRTDPMVLLFVTFVLTWVLTELVTNVAAAAIVFPFIMSAAQHMLLDPRPFAVVVAIAASTSFVTPFGYQTNLMVYGPGGYRYSDFARVGVPIALWVLLVTMLVVPQVWPLTRLG